METRFEAVINELSFVSISAVFCSSVVSCVPDFLICLASVFHGLSDRDYPATSAKETMMLRFQPYRHLPTPLRYDCFP